MTDERIEQLDRDWLQVFWEISGRSSNKDMQELLAKILAGEIAQPGTFSAATVLALSTLSKHQAGLFQQLCSMSFKYGNSVQVMLDLPDLEKGNAGYNPIGSTGIKGRQLIEFGLDHTALLELNVARLLASLPGDQHEDFKNFYACNTLEFAGKPVRIEVDKFLEKWGSQESDNEAKNLTCCVLSLTSTGIELRSILALKPNEAYVVALQRALDKSGARLVPNRKAIDLDDVFDGLLAAW
ncbi:MAG: DUF2806 domain-containing protein [Pseudomonadota bacterium]